MKLWGFILGIFIFSLLTSAINDAGLLTVGEVDDFNSDNITSSTSTIKEIVTDDSIQSEDNYFAQLLGIDAIFIVVKMFKVLISALGMTVYILPTLLSYGVPAGLASMFQLIVTFMECIFLFQVWRRFKIEN